MKLFYIKAMFLCLAMLVFCIDVEAEELVDKYIITIESGSIQSTDSKIQKKDIVPDEIKKKDKDSLAKLNVSPDKEFSRDRTYVADISKNKAKELKNLGYQVYPAKKMKILSSTKGDLASYRSLYGAYFMGTEVAHNSGLTGKGVKIGIMDSGISTSNPYIQVAGGYNFYDYSYDYQDVIGHGTHVAGIIGGDFSYYGAKSIAPDSILYSLKVSNDDGIIWNYDVADALDWAIANDLDIVNMSFGMAQYDPWLEMKIDEAFESGIVLIAAAGNVGQMDSVTYPAAFDSVIAVSATNQTGHAADYSSWGNEVDLSAPGDSIISVGPYRGYLTMSGTSQAAPHVTGAIALLKELYPTMSSYDLRDLIMYYAADLGTKGWDPYFGYGIIQAPVDKQNLTIPAPKSFQAEVTGDGKVSLTWSTYSYKYTKFIVKRSDGSTIYRGSGNTFLDQTVKPDSNYTYTLVTQQFGVSAPEIQTSVQTPVNTTPEVPTNIRYALQRSDLISFVWDYPSEIIYDSSYGSYFEVYRGNSLVFRGNRLWFTDRGLVSGAYTYRVRAIVNKHASPFVEVRLRTK